MNAYRTKTRNSRKLFTVTADRTHKLNFARPVVPRGGLRL